MNSSFQLDDDLQRLLEETFGPPSRDIEPLRKPAHSNRIGFTVIVAIVIAIGIWRVAFFSSGMRNSNPPYSTPASVPAATTTIGTHPIEVPPASPVAHAGKPKRLAPTTMEVELRLFLQGDEMESLAEGLRKREDRLRDRFRVAILRLWAADDEVRTNVTKHDLQIEIPFTFERRAEGKKHVPGQVGAEKYESELFRTVPHVAVTAHVEFENLVPKAHYLVRYYYGGRPMGLMVGEAGSQVRFDKQTVGQVKRGASTVSAPGLVLLPVPPSSLPSSLPDYQPKNCGGCIDLLLDLVASDFQRDAALELFKRYPATCKELESGSVLRAYLTFVLTASELNPESVLLSRVQVVPSELDELFSKKGSPPKQDTRYPTRRDVIARATAAALLAGTNFRDQDSLVTPLVNGIVNAQDDLDALGHALMVARQDEKTRAKMTSVNEAWIEELKAAIQRLPENARKKAEQELTSKQIKDR